MPGDAQAKLSSLVANPTVGRLLGITLLAEMGYAVLNISAMPMYLKFERGFGASLAGFALVAFLLSEALFKGPMGHLADRYGRKTLMTIGPALTVATSLLTLALPKDQGVLEVAALLLLRVFDGLGAAMVWPAAFALMSDSVADEQRQRSMSLLNLCYLLGVALALPVGGLVNDLYSSKAASLYLAAGVFLAVAIGINRLLPGDHAHREAHPIEGEFKIGDLISAMRKIPSYVVLSLITFVGIGFPMAIIKYFAEDQFDMSETRFGFMVVLPGAIAMAILSVPMSRLGEQLGRVRAVHLGMGLCTVGLTVVALGGFIEALREPAIIAIATAPIGVGFLLAIPSWMASVSDVDCKRRAANLGAVMTAQGMGAILGAPIGAFLYDHYGDTPAGRYSPFMGCAVCVAIGWAMTLKLLKDKPGSPEPAATDLKVQS